MSIYGGAPIEGKSVTFTKNHAIAISQNILSHTNGIVSSSDVNRGEGCAVDRKKEGLK